MLSGSKIDVEVPLGQRGKRACPANVAEKVHEYEPCGKWLKIRNGGDIICPEHGQMH